VDECKPLVAGTELKLHKEMEKKVSFKCGTFGASGLAERTLATGNFEGYMQLWDLEHSDTAVMDVKAHTSIVNAIDGCGGQAKGRGLHSSTSQPNLSRYLHQIHPKHPLTPPKSS